MAAIAEQLTKLQGESEAEHAKHREEIDKRENDRCTLEREKAEITAALDDAEEAYAEKSLELEEAQPCKGSHFGIIGRCRGKKCSNGWWWRENK